jgi:hypothetical protein
MNASQVIRTARGSRVVGFAVMDGQTFSSHRFATMGRPPRR